MIRCLPHMDKFRVEGDFAICRGEVMGRVYKCAVCNGNKLSIVDYYKERWVCEYCGTEQDPTDFQYGNKYLMLEKARIDLEDRRFLDAARMYNEILKGDPHNVYALTGRMLCEFRFDSIDQLGNLNKPLIKDHRFARILEYAESPKFVEKMLQYNTQIITKICKNKSDKYTLLNKKRDDVFDQIRFYKQKQDSDFFVSQILLIGFVVMFIIFWCGNLFSMLINILIKLVSVVIMMYCVDFAYDSISKGMEYDDLINDQSQEAAKISKDMHALHSEIEFLEDSDIELYKKHGIKRNTSV